MAKTKKINKKTLKTRKYRKGGGFIENLSSIFTRKNMSSKIPIISKETPIISKETSNRPFHVFFIDGLDCLKEGTQFNHFLVHGDVEKNDFTYICESHTATASTKIKNYSTVVKTSCALKPLNSSENKRMLQKIIDQILEKANENDNIYVYGWSFGGMIVNRVVEILVKSYSEDIRLKKIYFTTVGSIYITKKDIGSIDLINYISVGDVANTCTRGIEHTQYVSQQKLKEKYTEISLDEQNKILYKKRKGIPIIYDVCFVNPDTISCSQTINRIPIVRGKTEWKIHFNYWDLLYNLMRCRTNNIEKIIIGDKVEEEFDDDSVSETSEDVHQYQSLSAPGYSGISDKYTTNKQLNESM